MPSFGYEYGGGKRAALARAWEAHLIKQGFGGRKAYMVAQRKAAKMLPVPAQHPSA